MAVIIGSARSADDYTSGWNKKAKKGDQRQTATPDYKGEVSMQNWYRHKQDWIVLRPKSKTVADKIAYAMEAACNNKNFGYSQPTRQTSYDVAKKVGFDPRKVTTPCDTDCSKLVQICCRYAGIKVGDFHTADEAEVLMKTGAFDKLTAAKYTNYSTNLCRGDILVTKTKGHTVVVITNGANIQDEPEEEKKPVPSMKVVKASRGAQSKLVSLAGTYKVIAYRLNMRDGAGKQHKILTVLDRDTKVKCYGYYTMHLGARWLYVVAVKDNTEYVGFCSMDYLRKQ